KTFVSFCLLNVSLQLERSSTSFSQFQLWHWQKYSFARKSAYKLHLLAFVALPDIVQTETVMIQYFDLSVIDVPALASHMVHSSSPGHEQTAQVPRTYTVFEAS